MISFGLCCLFRDEPVKFRTTTAKALAGLPREQQLSKLSGICLDNAHNVQRALESAARLGIGAFRVMSPLFPRMTHPDVGYSLEQLPAGEAIAATMSHCRELAAARQIRLSFHPDQFVVLSSPHPAVVTNSIAELIYQAQLAEALGADVINIHAGGVYGDKQAALLRFATVFAELPEIVKSRLTLENDDTSYTPADLLPLCQKLTIPLVYDVHHHRCNPDGLGIEEATELAGEIWHRAGREQYCHISSPRTGWGAGDPKPHADFIAREDVPDCWLTRDMTVDVEAKAKEVAVVKLMTDLAG